MRTQVTGGKKDLQAVLAEARAMPVVVGRVKGAALDRCASSHRSRPSDGKLIRPKEKKSGRKITVRERSLRSLLLVLFVSLSFSFSLFVPFFFFPLSLSSLRTVQFLAEAHTRQESTSELTEVDLREIVTAESWAKLSAEEQASLLPMLPEVSPLLRCFLSFLFSLFLLGC
jgi:hypothetical protein